MNEAAGATAFRNGAVVTMNPLQPDADAVLVVDGRIKAVGTWSDIKPAAPQGLRVVDLNGAALLPGFVEAHAHPLMSGMSWGDPVVDIRAVHTPTYDAAIAKMRRRAAKARPGEILWFLGLDAQLHAGMREPSRDELDEISRDNPIVVQTSNYHGSYLNTAAIEAFGIDESYVAPKGGKAILDAEGRFWKFEEAATWALAKYFYDQCGDERNRKVMKEWLEMFARAGYTTSSEIFVAPGFTAYYERVVREPDTPIRLFGYESATPDLTMSVGPDYGDDLWNIRGLKIIGDGSVLLGNVWLSKPYLNTEMTLQKMGLPEDNTGHMNYSRDELRRMISAYAGQGWQISVHAHGDLTIDTVLDVYEEIIPAFPQAALPFRMEHCGTMRTDQVQRAHSLGVACSFFLPYIYYWGDALADNLLGPERAARFAPSGEAARLGMRMSHHCDSPMTWPHALLTLYLATTRKSTSGRVLGENMRMGIDQALRAVTIDAAYQLRLDDRIGSIEPGKYADFVILREDPRTCEPDKLKDIDVLGTYLAGRRIWGDL